MASDDADAVKRWIDEGKIKKPTAADLARWEASREARFESVVVQPFVLVRPRLAPDLDVN